METVQFQQAQTIRREYVAPQLVQYGSVTDLTAGGSNGQAECAGGGKGSNAPCRP